MGTRVEKMHKRKTISAFKSRIKRVLFLVFLSGLFIASHAQNEPNPILPDTIFLTLGNDIEIYNDKGELIGISTLTAKEGQNLNFAIPIDDVLDGEEITFNISGSDTVTKATISKSNISAGILL